MDRKKLDQLGEQLIGSAIEVHRALGPGLLESAYEMALCHELAQRGIPFERQVAMPVAYKGAQLDCGYRLDVVLADEIIVELKAVESIAPIHEAQILSYLRISGKPLGYLINFNVRLLKNGIHRFANFPKTPCSPCSPW
jgi:GxxExxY protein